MRSQWRDGICHGRRLGLFFIVAVVFIFVQAGFFAARTRSPSHLDSHHLENDDSSKWSSYISSFLDSEDKDVIHDHPIPKLMQDNELLYRKKLDSQSKTLEAAVAEYQRRYNQLPPQGFDQWWAFAQKYNVVMVDEYDGLMRDLEPFRILPGVEFRRRVGQVASLPSIDLVRIQGGKGKTVNMNKGFEDSEVSARANGFLAMTGKFVDSLPDMDFPINAKAESRVLVPWEHQKYPNLTVQDSSAGIESVLGGPFAPDWRSDGNVWEAWRRTCEPSSPARRLFSSLRNPFAVKPTDLISKSQRVGGDFNFASTTAYELDYCMKPYAHYSQGHFFSDWRTIPALYPVLSPAKARGFLDIKIPSHYYYGSTKRYTYGWDPINLELKDVDPMEVPWEEKEDKIFWRGADTGGGNSPPHFSGQYHRHRFLRMSSDKSQMNRTVTFADPPTSSRYVSVSVPVAKLNEELMDVAFVKATNPKNYPGGLQALMEDHRFADSVPLGKHWSYKYLVDFDGMSYSGRFMAFLASDSTPVKATVYDEFFTEWIQPWVHFVPLSTTYREIYNLHAYFSGPIKTALEAVNSTQLLIPPEQRKRSDGDAQLRRIARAGKQWKRTVGRTLDMEAYVYRLCLEYARLWADDRESMNFSL